MTGKCCLSIAGSDSGGNAGIQADLRTFGDHGMHGCTVITALTAQNPSGVFAIQNAGEDFIRRQLDAVLGAYSVAAAKTGMIPTASAVETVAAALAEHPGIPVVVDPVMVATSGAGLMEKSALEAAGEHLFPLAALLTPNLPEAEAIAGSARRAGRDASAERAAELAAAIGARYGVPVLVKGGHGDGDESADVLFKDGMTRRFSLPWIENPVSTHGTGCTLSSAIACRLAMGDSLEKAVEEAKAYVHRAIASSYQVGPACGVLGRG